MSSFSVGEEVLFDTQRYVIAAIDSSSMRYRLLASTPEGARVRWAPHDRVEKIARYTTPKDDTSRA